MEVELCTEDWPGRLLGRLDEVLVVKQMFPDGFCKREVLRGLQTGVA